MLPPGDSALRARLLARLAAALQPSPTATEPVAVAREAIAIARRLGDETALLDTLYAAVAGLMDIVEWTETRALNLEVERLALAAGDRERLLRTHLRLAVCHLGVGEVAACDARLERLRDAGRRAARALVRLVGGHAARGARDHGRALRGRRTAGGRGAGSGAGRRTRGRRSHLDHEPGGAASRRRSSRGHAGLGARGAALARCRPRRRGLAVDGLGADARAARARGRCAHARRPPARGVPHPGWQPVLDLLRRARPSPPAGRPSWRGRSTRPSSLCATPA